MYLNGTRLLMPILVLLVSFLLEPILTLCGQDKKYNARHAILPTNCKFIQLQRNEMILEIDFEQWEKLADDEK